ncbi:denn domain-containing [Holotrichia oblita]|uniref:Denn domain-containing n=1 Tax=Holotrichia oblita TaxID=644536 RepID=A0ACB9TV94_HOLOL|nr:denn domain-containing [Holotrichia oblita]
MAFSDYLLAPMPFLIGVPDEVLKNVNKCDVGEVVILDADNNTIETPFDDVHNLPSEVVASLKKQLKNRSALLGDGVSRAFLRALVQLIGGYRDALSFEDKANFDEEKFIETRPSSLQPFLKEMLQLQIFRQFIEDRLNILGAGLGFTDQFETEVSVYSEKSSSKLKQQYKEWTSTMKKEGTAFFRNVKDKVKDGGKGMRSAYKGLRSKLKDNQNPRQFENGLKSSLDKPRSAPNSPTNKRRPMTFRRETPMSLTGSAVERPYSPLSPMSQTLSPDSPDHSQTASPSLDIPKIDLMNEMKDILKLRLDTPPIDRSLKPVRSLENFKNSSPMSSPERWVFPSRSPNPPLTSPPTRLFLPTQKSQDTQNLLQSPDDVFSSPPVPPRPSKTRDLFGTAPFIIGGGHNENGHPVFLVANQHTVDVVRLSPPTNSPRRKKDEETEDLIRLDSSSSDIDDFDPLKSNSANSLSNNTFLQNFHLPSSHNQVPMSVTNPLYNYENHLTSPNGTLPSGAITPRNPDRETVELLQEYGLDFQSFSRSKFDPFVSNRDNAGKVTSQNQWTKFE